MWWVPEPGSLLMYGARGRVNTTAKETPDARRDMVHALLPKASAVAVDEPDASLPRRTGRGIPNFGVRDILAP